MSRKNKSNNNKNGSDFLYLRHLSAIMSEVGILGFLILIGAFIFLGFSTLEQKRLFIEKFVLLEDVGSNPYPAVLVVLVLIFVLILQSAYCNKMLKLRKEENNRIGQEKSNLQEILLNKKLRSSS